VKQHISNHIFTTERVRTANRPVKTHPNVGKRTNVTGSKKFCPPYQGRFATEAVLLLPGNSRKWCIRLLINMMTFVEGVTTTLLSLSTGSKPDIARIPIMIDKGASLEIIEAGPKCVQGKCNELYFNDGR